MKHYSTVFLILAITGLAFWGLHKTVEAQSPDGSWSDFENISVTPTASTYPCIVADAQGYVHVFWSEDVGGDTNNTLLNPDGTPALDSRGNPLNVLTDDGNTLFYTRWDRNEWSEPIDIQVNPNGNIEYPRAVVDPQGMLHVVWVGSNGAATWVMYSRVWASKADSAQDWTQPIALVERTLYAYYPVDIAVDGEGGLHVLYFKLGENSGTYVINSSDGGNTWSDPIQLYQTQDPRGSNEGIAPVELVVDHNNRLHATWSRYDISGNGKAIYYSQSSDLGKTWSRPFEVDRWQIGWYETDWLSTGVVGDEIHLVWEGSGNVAYLNERISKDGGQTWGENHHILLNLVGENGFANLVTDSANQLHMLVTKRGDPSAYAHGIWYTTWDHDHWPDPVLLGTRNPMLYEKMGKQEPSDLAEVTRGTFTGNGLRYQMSAIVNGNELFTVVANEWDGEIWSSHTSLDAPYIPPKPYPQLSALSDVQPTLTPTPAVLPIPTPTFQLQSNGPVQEGGVQPAQMILIGIIPALVIMIGIIVYSRYKRN